MAKLYDIADNLRTFSALADTPVARILRRAGLPEDFLSQRNSQVDREMFYRVWDAAKSEMPAQYSELVLAKAYAHGPFVPAIFAFSSAPTLELGLRRLAEFKPVMAPIEITFETAGDNLTFSISCPGAPDGVATSFVRFELYYILECARKFTSRDIQPLSVGLPASKDLGPDEIAHIGVQPQDSATLRATLSAEDAASPLVTRSAALWDNVAPALTAQREAQAAGAAQNGAAGVTTRVRHVLTESLSGGVCTADAVAARLHMSKRSLQRRLSDEGTSFKALLNETRTELSHRYLRESTLSVPEISYLLGFRETASFFRAFQAWTGTTPGAFRNQSSKQL